MSREQSLALLATANHVHIASTDTQGAPILRPLHGVIVGDSLMFHAAPVGEKIDILGRPCVVSCEEVVASIPSYWVDPERACPATTLYRSVQIHGTVEVEESPEIKAAALAALMQKFQPEGGFVPIESDHPLYKKAIQGLLVAKVSLERIDGKAKLAQNRSATERSRILGHLWARGEPGDLTAIERILEACPDTPRPAFLASPAATRLCISPTRSDAAQIAQLLSGTYWNTHVTTRDIEAAHLGSSAWVVARDDRGSPIASARAISDTTKHAWIYDVIVSPDWRRKHIGDAVLRLLLDHPRVRAAKRVHLGTRDAQGFYARMGFVSTEERAPRGFVTTEMTLIRE